MPALLNGDDRSYKSNQFGYWYALSYVWALIALTSFLFACTICGLCGCPKKSKDPKDEEGKAKGNTEEVEMPKEMPGIPQDTTAPLLPVPPADALPTKKIIPDILKQQSPGQLQQADRLTTIDQPEKPPYLEIDKTPDGAQPGCPLNRLPPPAANIDETLDTYQTMCAVNSKFEASGTDGVGGGKKGKALALKSKLPAISTAMLTARQPTIKADDVVGGGGGGGQQRPAQSMQPPESMVAKKPTTQYVDQPPAIQSKAPACPLMPNKGTVYVGAKAERKGKGNKTLAAKLPVQSQLV